MIPFMADDIYRNLVCSVDKSAPDFRPSLRLPRPWTKLGSILAAGREHAVCRRRGRSWVVPPATAPTARTRQPLCRAVRQGGRRGRSSARSAPTSSRDELNVKEGRGCGRCVRAVLATPSSRTCKYQSVRNTASCSGQDPRRAVQIPTTVTATRAMAELQESTGALHLDVGGDNGSRTRQKDDLLIDVTAEGQGTSPRQKAISPVALGHQP